MGRIVTNYGTQDSTGGATTTLTVPTGMKWVFMYGLIEGSGANVTIHITDGTNRISGDWISINTAAGTDYPIMTANHSDSRQQMPGSPYILDEGYQVVITWAAAARVNEYAFVVEEIPK